MMFGNKSANKDGVKLAEKLAREEAKREAKNWSDKALAAGRKVEQYKHDPTRKSFYEKALREERRAIEIFKYWMKRA